MNQKLISLILHSHIIVMVGIYDEDVRGIPVSCQLISVRAEISAIIFTALAAQKLPLLSLGNRIMRKFVDKNAAHQNLDKTAGCSAARL
ncbi:MAG: hypothetical protein PHO32_09710, partial [Candidatus Cloacimonetes bacterium]|nr:hypothetical protein [Candidatus Cloacimonadota bacterium]